MYWSSDTETCQSYLIAFFARWGCLIYENGRLLFRTCPVRLKYWQEGSWVVSNLIFSLLFFLDYLIRMDFLLYLFYSQNLFPACGNWWLVLPLQFFLDGDSSLSGYYSWENQNKKCPEASKTCYHYMNDITFFKPLYISLLLESSNPCFWINALKHRVFVNNNLKLLIVICFKTRWILFHQTSFSNSVV